ncbi:hypothetical protein G9A89_002413 [Geosiphon pyriformis]|nr:hypothetical protein G9A89_002413 [Geosiphon pyriformis]
MEEKLVMMKTQVVKKIFLVVNGFGRTTILLKFERIIRSIFTSEISIKKTALLIKENGIIANIDIKKQKMHLDLDCDHQRNFHKHTKKNDYYCSIQIW